jgi:cullin 1
MCFKSFMHASSPSGSYRTRRVSDDAEKQVLGDLRSACGFSSTPPSCSACFRTLARAATSNNAFNEWRPADAISHDVSMLVLTAGAWPISASAATYAVPAMVERSETLFREFYSTLHVGRRLTWLYNFCKADLRTRCWSRRYELTCSAFQMSVLLLFNEMDSVSLSERGRRSRRWRPPTRRRRCARCSRRRVLAKKRRTTRTTRQRRW